ncbi:MAG: response regulator [Verrucomicrobiota bacterium]
MGFSSPAANGKRIPITDQDALSLLTHDISNTLMVIQSRLDALRNKVGNDRALADIEAACLQSSTVLRGALSLLGKHQNVKELFALGDYLENQLETLLSNAHHSLRMRTHRECEIYTSPGTLNLVMEQVLNHYLADPEDEKPELYIEVYKGAFDNDRFGVVQISGPGKLTSDQGVWKMLESLMHLQGGELVINDNKEKPQINLMFPVFKKRHSIYAIRNQTEVDTAMILEDNKDVAESVSMTLKALGIPTVEIFNKPAQAVEWLSAHTPSLVVTDYSMFGMNGIEFLKQSETALASSKVVLMSGMPLDDFESELEELQISVEVLMKPLKGDDLLRVVMQALNQQTARSQKKAQSLKETVHVPQRPDIHGNLA